jgi:hypothetical protein
MKTDIRRRLVRLEEILRIGAAREEVYQFKLALTSIVCFHAGTLSAGGSLQTAWNRAMDMKHGKLKSAVKPHNDDWPDSWLVLEKANTMALKIMIAARDELPLADADGRRPNRFDVLRKLYADIPDEMKSSHRLRPILTDYVSKKGEETGIL